METVYYTPREVAERLRLRVQTVYDYIRKGRLPAVRLGNRCRIAHSDLEAFLERTLVLELGTNFKVDLAVIARIHVEEGNRVTIIGTSGDQTYHGTLILRNTAGGDECWVCDVNGENCHWESPCP